MCWVATVQGITKSILSSYQENELNLHTSSQNSEESEMAMIDF
jgi:hypothetical protein